MHAQEWQSAAGISGDAELAQPIAEFHVCNARRAGARQQFAKHWRETFF
jgi:hypothetical protein